MFSTSVMLSTFALFSHSPFAVSLLFCKSQ